MMSLPPLARLRLRAVVELLSELLRGPARLPGHGMSKHIVRVSLEYVIPPRLQQDCDTSVESTQGRRLVEKMCGCESS